MARERFRVVAQDAHFNGALTRLTHSVDSAEQLAELIGNNAPNLTIVRIEPLERALRRELYDARGNARILPETSGLFELGQVEREHGFARRELIEERLKSCCALAELFGNEAMESLANVLRRFDRDVEGSHALDGLDSCAFSLSFAWGAPDYRLTGGLIFHESSKTWGTHT
jgi:HEAT repeat protein